MSLDFKPARPILPFIRLVQWVNARFLLRNTPVEIPGEELARFRALPRGASILIAPNHADSTDCFAIIEISRRIGRPIAFMAARETFDLAHGWVGVLFQLMGGFSVVRGGDNAEANRFARRILKEGRFPLLIFPEGEIYFLNDRVMPIKPGVALFALETAEEHDRETPGHPGTFVVPVGIKYRFREDATAAMEGVMVRMEREVLGEPREGALYERISRLGETLLARKEAACGLPALEGEIHARVDRLRKHLLVSLERKCFGKEGKETDYDLDRARRIIVHLMEQMLDAGEKDPEPLPAGFQAYPGEAYLSTPRQPAPPRSERAALQQDLDDAWLAARLVSFADDYLREHPSPERFAETIKKLEREIFHLYNPPQLGLRRASIRIAPPIDARDYLPGYRERKGRKPAILALTARLQEELQRLVNELSIG